MSENYNVYCDESCHLENDGQHIMVLGSVWCPLGKVREITMRLREIRERHGLKKDFEIKWTKVSPAKQQFYLDILDYFFDDDDLHLRVLIVPDKSTFRHANSHQTHDDWYYQIYFLMLEAILNPEDAYRIYMDIKDTRSAEKVKRLHDVLCAHLQDHDKQIIQRLQTVRSHEISLMQVTDLLIGAISYANRSINTSPAKNAFVKRLQDRSDYELNRSTLPREMKTNIFIWKAKEGE